MGQVNLGRAKGLRFTVCLSIDALHKFRLYTVRMDQSDSFIGGNLFHLEYPPGFLSIPPRKNVNFKIILKQY